MKIEEYLETLPENLLSGEDVQLSDKSFREIFKLIDLGDIEEIYEEKEVLVNREMEDGGVDGVVKGLAIGCVDLSGEESFEDILKGFEEAERIDNMKQLIQDFMLFKPVVWLNFLIF